MTLRELWDDFKAWRRGEHRIVPYGVKGRVYARKNDPAGLIALGKFKGTIRLSGFYNAKEGKWYDIDERGNKTPRKV